MASFEPGADLEHELDWELLQNGFVILYWSPQRLADTTHWLTRRSYHVVSLDVAPWTNEAQLHADVAAALNFPAWYGRNLNVLNDCLDDVAEGRYGLATEMTGLVLVLRNFEQLYSRDPYVAGRFLDLWAGQARHAALVGHRMMCLVQTNDPRLAIEPVGAQPVTWNYAEAADRARCL